MRKLIPTTAAALLAFTVPTQSQPGPEACDGPCRCHDPEMFAPTSEPLPLFPRGTRPEEPPGPRLVLEETDFTITLHEWGRVLSVESEEFWLASRSGRDTTLFRDFTKRLYRHFADEFDFIIVSTRQDTLPDDAAYAGVFLIGENTIEGIGFDIPFNFGEVYGSAGKLQGTIHLMTVAALRTGPSLHEIAHRWGNYLTNFPTVSRAHWGRSSVGGQLGGFAPNSLVDLGGGRYQANNVRTGLPGSFSSVANGGNGLAYSNLELYLMGLVPASEVESPIQIAVDFEWENQNEGIFTASAIEELTIEQIIQVHGLRTPGPAASQKEFRILYVIQTPEPLSEEEWESADMMVENFELDGPDGSTLFNFWEATGGRATIQMEGLHEVLLPPTPLEALLGLDPGRLLNDVNEDSRVDAADLPGGTARLLAAR